MTLIHWKNWSAKHRFMFASVFPAFLMFIGITAFTIFARISEVAEETDEVARIVINCLAPVVSDDITNHQQQKIRSYLKTYAEASDQIVALVIRDTSGLSIASYRSDINSDHKETRLVTHPLALNPNSNLPIGSIEVLITTEAKQFRQKVRLMVWVIFGGVILLGTVVIGFDIAKSINRPIEDLISSVEKIGRGELVEISPISKGGQFRDLQRKINEMSLYLNDFRNQLESEVGQRTIELEKQKEIVVESNRIKTVLIQKLNTIAEVERKNIASELHDEINSQLIGIRLPLHALIKITKELEPTPEHEEIIQNAMAATTHLASMHRAVRDLCKRLRPESIDVMGIQGAIESLIINQNRLHPECRYSLQIADDLEKLTESGSLHVFRLIQESITNVSKHAEATTCAVEIRSIDENLIQISVKDNGKGFSVTSGSEGIGLIGMRERVESMKGSLEIETYPSKGTTITFIIPTTG